MPQSRLRPFHARAGGFGRVWGVIGLEAYCYTDQQEEKTRAPGLGFGVFFTGRSRREAATAGRIPLRREAWQDKDGSGCEDGWNTKKRQES